MRAFDGQSPVSLRQFPPCGSKPKLRVTTPAGPESLCWQSLCHLTPRRTAPAGLQSSRTMPHPTRLTVNLASASLFTHQNSRQNSPRLTESAMLCQAAPRPPSSSRSRAICENQRNLRISNRSRGHQPVRHPRPASHRAQTRHRPRTNTHLKANQLLASSSSGPTSPVCPVFTPRSSLRMSHGPHPITRNRRHSVLFPNVPLCSAPLRNAEQTQFASATGGFCGLLRDKALH